MPERREATTRVWGSAPDGDQMDIVEVMDISVGFLRHHRVYWGWASVNMLRTGEHPK